jgi:hypothetical protein
MAAASGTSPRGGAVTLAAKIQSKLAKLYRVEAPAVDGFVRASAGGREVLEVRQNKRTLDLALYLPREAMDPEAPVSLDLYCQVAEGVSHFLYLVERARRRLPATQLELELQAEVDKYLMVLQALADSPAANINDLRDRLFGRVRFLHAAGSEQGDRYRMANQLAARFVGTLTSRDHGVDSPRQRLRRFFDAGQREKIEMVMAA